MEKVIKSGTLVGKKGFSENLKEAEGLNGAKGKEVSLKVTNPSGAEGRDIIYLSVEGETIGLTKETDKDVSTLISEGRYRAYITGAEGKFLLVTVEEAEEANSAILDKAKAKSSKTELENLVGKDDANKRLTYMAGFGLTEKAYPRLFSMFLALIVEMIKSRFDAGLELIPEPETLFVTAKKKGPGNALLAIAEAMVTGGSIILEGPMARGKNVAWESMSWLTCCEEIRLQWHGKMTKAEAFCHQTTDNASKDAMTVDGLAGFLEWISNATKLKLFKRKPESEDGLRFGLSIIKSLSPSLKMTNGPIMEALELANKGVGVILVNDELNLGNANTVTGCLNDLMDGHSPSIFVAGKGDVPINHSRLFIGGTQNGVGGGYVGTTKQNISTIGRAQVLQIEGSVSILPLLRTAEMADAVGEADLLTIDKIDQEFDNGVENGTYPPESLNLRGFKRVVSSISLGFNIEDAVIRHIINGIQDEDSRDMLKVVIDGVIKNS